MLCCARQSYPACIVVVVRLLSQDGSFPLRVMCGPGDLRLRAGRAAMSLAYAVTVKTVWPVAASMTM